MKNYNTCIFTISAIFSCLLRTTCNASITNNYSQNDIFNQARYEVSKDSSDKPVLSSDFNSKRKMYNLLNLQELQDKREYSTFGTDEKELETAINEQFVCNTVNQPPQRELFGVDDSENNANSVVNDYAQVITPEKSVEETPISSHGQSVICSVNSYNGVNTGVVYPGRLALTEIIQRQKLTEPENSSHTIEEAQNSKRFNKNVSKKCLAILDTFFATGHIGCIQKLVYFLRLPSNIPDVRDRPKDRDLLITKIARELFLKLSQSFKLLCGCNIPKPKYDSFNKRQGRGNHPNLLRFMLTISLIKNCIAKKRIYYCYTTPSCPNGISGWIPAKYLESKKVTRERINILVSNLELEIGKRVAELNECIQKNIEKIKQNSDKIDTLIKIISKIEGFINNPSGVLGFVLNWKCQQGDKSLKELIENDILQPTLEGLIDLKQNKKLIVLDG